jgi:hypothetical protein
MRRATTMTREGAASAGSIRRRLDDCYHYAATRTLMDDMMRRFRGLHGHLTDGARFRRFGVAGRSHDRNR